MEAKGEVEISAVSVVLGDCDLLAEIFLRLAFPTDLVRAAAVCRRWLRAASKPAFLRRFRDTNPPRLLGFYLTTFSTNSTNQFGVDFIPMLPQPPELAAVVRRGRFGLDSYGSRSTRVMDCLNGRAIVYLFCDGDFTYGEHSPLHPARGLLTFPRLPMMDDRKRYIFRDFLSKECGNGLSYFWFELDYSGNEEKTTARVYKLQGDAWIMQTSATTQISGLHSSMLYGLSFFLVDDKIYMGITVHSILVLDLTSSTFSAIEYPDTVAFNGEIMLSRADGSGVCLVNVNELQLRVWLHRGCDGSMGDWLLVNTICLHDFCADLKISNSTTENDDEDDEDDAFIHAVGHNAEFVFLQVYGCVLYLDVRSSAVQKVYGPTQSNTRVSSTHPFVMPWPPIFPVLQE
ncbi:unnamed protein product [Urochloa decumbens]|uniref:F-box domain-containing protein n=1 Tax=Urochloa decumbens TaxID=240449 RepID=A0ABC8ZZX0_9POAL